MLKRYVQPVLGQVDAKDEFRMEAIPLVENYKGEWCKYDEAEAALQAKASALAIAQIRIDHLVDIVGMFWRFTPPDFKDEAGRTFHFIDPDPLKTLEALKVAMGRAIINADVAAGLARSDETFSMTQVRAFCGFLTAKFVELHHMHPELVSQAWDEFVKSFKAAPI